MRICREVLIALVARRRSIRILGGGGCWKLGAVAPGAVAGRPAEGRGGRRPGAAAGHGSQRGVHLSIGRAVAARDLRPQAAAPDEIRGEYGTTATATSGVHFCEYLPRLAARGRSVSDRADDAPSGRPAVPQRAQQLRCTCCTPAAASCRRAKRRRSIVLPTPRRFEWPSIGSMIAYACAERGRARPAAGGGDSAGATTSAARDGARHVGPQVRRWRVDLAPPCHAPDRGGSCPNCFSHDQPNDPARAPASGRRPGGTTAVAAIPTFICPTWASTRAWPSTRCEIGADAARATRRGAGTSSTASRRCGRWTPIATRPWN